MAPEISNALGAALSFTKCLRVIPPSKNFTPNAVVYVLPLLCADAMAEKINKVAATKKLLHNADVFRFNNKQR